jgi:hypothetical protein
MTDHRATDRQWVVPELPAPAGSLELYRLFNHEEMKQERKRWDKMLAKAIYRNLENHG